MKRCVTPLLLLTLCLGFISAQAEMLVRVARSQSMHPMGMATLSLSATRAWGGVVLQAQATVLNDKGAVLPITSIDFGAFDKSNKTLCVRYAGECYSLTISADTLVRLVSWIDNGGTGVYSAHFLDEAELIDAGLTELDGDYDGDYIVTEFAGSAFLEPLAHYLDFPDRTFIQRVPNVASIRAKWNAGLKAGPGEDYDYVVSDLDSRFTARLASSRVELSGTVYRYSRSVVPGNPRATVTDVEMFMDLPLSQLKTLAQKQLVRYREYFDMEEPELARFTSEANASASTHKDSLTLAQTAALLRAVYNGNRPAWKHLLSKFSEPPAVARTQ